MALNDIRNPSGGYYQSPSLYALGWERWGGPNLNNAATRAQVQQAHRDLFVGVGAAQTGDSCAPSPSVPNSVAAFVQAAGVVLQAPFVTRFNAGEGDSFGIQGGPGATTGWNGLGLQDVQPTWLCPQGPGQSAAINYGDSYDGGSSLTVTGSGIVSLYSTDMTPPTKPTAIVRYKGSSVPLRARK